MAFSGWTGEDNILRQTQLPGFDVKKYIPRKIFRRFIFTSSGLPSLFLPSLGMGAPGQVRTFFRQGRAQGWGDIDVEVDKPPQP
jgi:hypothetical protein